MSALGELSSAQATEGTVGRWPGIGREELAHEGECLPVLAGVRRRDAIARHHELEVAHVCVAAREQHALGVVSPVTISRLTPRWSRSTPRLDS